MRLKDLAGFLALVLIGANGVAQPQGMAVSFDDGSLVGWHWDAATFELSARDSALLINYHRTTQSWEWHNFHFVLPQPISVASAPKISLRVRSNLDTELTLKPTYSNQGSDWLPVNVPGDNQWQYYEFGLLNYGDGLLERIYFYLDGGTTTPRSGTVWFDDLLIGTEAILPQVIRLQVVSQSPSAVELAWQCNLGQRVAEYRVYRGEESGFPLTAEHLVGTTSELRYRDTAVSPNRTYFYRVVAVDSAGRQGPPSAEVGAHTYGAVLQPRVSIRSTNRQSVGLYEKFEAVANVENVVFTNPYDPEQIALWAEFLSPSGRQWRIPGFYDNYESRNEWKVRFAPNELGPWSFRLVLSNQGSTVTSEEGSFWAEASPHHGWIRPSPVNRHYFVHDDGTPFYGIAFYYPWGVSNGSSGLARFQQFGGNIFGYWNIMYGNEGRIIESLVSGIGRYDQAKCGRIDQILEWAESRNLMVMLAIWPHDLLSNTVWAHQWHNNPYNTVCDVRDFYSSEEAWRYQEKQYRYLIARWGYSRALAIWEIVNEINGTDGWESGRQQEATAWVARVHQFFKQNDPYQHPTTASMSGGWYWSDGYRYVDLPNVHLYETGWSAQFPNDPLRSSYYLYHRIAQQLYTDFDKPAIMGEAGYTDSYGRFNVPSPEYTALFHNALWASWAGGLAASPFWWAFNYGPIATDDLLKQLRAFGTVVRDFPYAYCPLRPADLQVESCDAFGMAADTAAFGWIRHGQGKRLGAHGFTLRGLRDTTYVVEWFDTWLGQRRAITYHRVRDGILRTTLPARVLDSPDVAFIIRIAQEGQVPARIHLSAFPEELLAVAGQVSQVTAVVVDSVGRLCTRADLPIHFQLTGPGRLSGALSQVPQWGAASVTYDPEGQAGVAQVIASGEGLVPDTVTIAVRDRVVIDDFEGYPAGLSLSNVWRAKSGTSALMSLAESGRPQGGLCLRIDYAIGNGKPPYAGVARDLVDVPSSPKAFRLWLRPDASGRTLSIVLLERSGIYWQYDVPLSGGEERVLEIPFSAFRPNRSTASIDWSQVGEIDLLVFRGSGSYGEGTVFLDDLELLYREASSGLAEKQSSRLPERVQILGNYPNPFNSRTSIAFELPRSARVRVEILDLAGRVVDVVWDGRLELGRHSLSWEPKAAPSGLYLISLDADGIRTVRKCLYLK
ncbi:MAG: DUF5060 domain-containing protein [candidate division KSB1 bacterium]|nr:DUF5060 domain-containing protein [candidate division KSB1 bacterium]